MERMSTKFERSPWNRRGRRHYAPRGPPARSVAIRMPVLGDYRAIFVDVTASRNRAGSASCAVCPPVPGSGHGLFRTTVPAPPTRAVGRPQAVLPGPVGADLMLAHSDVAAVTITGLGAYPTGPERRRHEAISLSHIQRIVQRCRRGVRPGIAGRAGPARAKAASSVQCRGFWVGRPVWS